MEGVCRGEKAGEGWLGIGRNDLALAVQVLDDGLPQLAGDPLSIGNDKDKASLVVGQEDRLPIAIVHRHDAFPAVAEIDQPDAVELEVGQVRQIRLSGISDGDEYKDQDLVEILQLNH